MTSPQKIKKNFADKNETQTRADTIMPTKEELRDFHKEIENEIREARKNKYFQYDQERSVSEGKFCYREIKGVCFRIPVAQGAISVSLYADRTARSRESFQQVWKNIISHCNSDNNNTYTFVHGHNNTISTIKIQERGEYHGTPEDVAWAVQKIQNLLEIFDDAMSNSGQVEAKKTVRPAKRHHIARKTKSPSPIGSSEASKEAANSNNDDPRQWGEFTELQGIQAYLVKKCLQKLHDIGEHVVAYRPEGGGVYYLGMNNGRPTLNQDLPKKQRVTLKQLVSWPMRSSQSAPRDVYDWHPGTKGKNGRRKSDFCTPRINPNTEFTDGSGIVDPVLRPQIVFLGANWSTTGNAGQLAANWSNGYCDQAKVVCDSILAGAYFTDFFKCYVETDFRQVDVDWPAGHIPYFDVCLNIFEDELCLLNDKFELKSKTKYIIVWGKKLFDSLNGLFKIHTNQTMAEYFSNINRNQKYTVWVFGRHYSPQGKFNQDTSCLESCRRIYEANDNGIALDGREVANPDQRRYKFALLEDENGNLVPYRGNPNHD